VYCPRCGNEAEAGDRFCSSCGASLPSREEEGVEEKPSLRERLSRLVGRTRRERLITLGTLAAIALAILAFVLLDPAEDDSPPPDAYSLAADEVCVAAKRDIARAAKGARGRDPGRFAQDLVLLVAQWRTATSDLVPSVERSGGAAELDIALRDVLVEAAVLARMGREGADEDAIGEQVGVVEATSASVEQAIDDLGLERCAVLQLGNPGSG
jgi:zinc-ribbon domain